MKYNINNCISNEENCLCKQIKRSVLRQIEFDDVITLRILLITDNGTFSLKNSVTYERDNDDYSHIVINSHNSHIKSTKNKNTVTVNEQVVKVEIIRDAIKWNYYNDEWDVICDIGIIIFTDSYTITVLAIDDMSTRLSMHINNSDKYIHGSERSLKNDMAELWQFKTENYTQLDRKRITIVG